MFLQLLGTLVFWSQIFLSHQQGCIIPTDFTSSINLNNLYSLSTNPNDVVFYLYPNAADQNDYDVITFDGTTSNVTSSRYNPALKSIFLIHGFAGNWQVAGNPQTIKNTYLQAGFAATNNIFAVDWGKLAIPVPNTGITLPVIPINNLNTALILMGYTLVYCNVPIVGQRVGDFVNYLNSPQQQLLAQGLGGVHVVGQSLGAQAAGFVGKRIIATNGGSKIGRISATEPAGPIYNEVALILPSQRLISTDATFVDVYHTNQGEMGYFGNVGQIDFYINGGIQQPSCTPTNATSVGQNLFCSHNTAPFYYAMSVTSSSYTGCNCALGVATCVPLTLCSLQQYLPIPITSTKTFGESCPTGSKGSYAINITLLPEYVALNQI